MRMKKRLLLILGIISLSVFASNDPWIITGVVDNDRGTEITYIGRVSNRNYCDFRINYKTGFVSVTETIDTNTSPRFQYEGCGFFLSSKVQRVGNRLKFQGKNGRDGVTSCVIEVDFDESHEPVRASLSTVTPSYHYDEKFVCNKLQRQFRLIRN